MKVWKLAGIGAALWLAVPLALGQAADLSVPVVEARAKGPNQINLTWPAVAEAGYGFLVEIQSAGDARFANWTELEPLRPAGGYRCDSSIVRNGARCNTSDPEGAQVYNPPTHGIPVWVTDEHYVDPQDESRAQFIAWGLKPDTDYAFRVRCYAGNRAPVYGGYSNPATAKTAAYAMRYVSPAGNDGNDGKGADAAHAWRTLLHGTAALECGEVLLVAGGNYEADRLILKQKCTAAAKAVVLVTPGESATVVSQPRGAGNALDIGGDHVVVDGLAILSPGVPVGEYAGAIGGSYNALLNVELHPPVVPTFHFGVVIFGNHNLLYRSYLHDYGSPDGTQNPNGGDGFVLTLMEHGARFNVIWSNHLTRGGHDSSMCKSGCMDNLWVNNVMDGGWGQAWVAGWPGERNLVEGNVVRAAGQLVPYFKPALQASQKNATIRRNVVIDSRSWALEVSSLGSGTASNDLIYNNTFYRPGGCYFQSASRGWQSYYNNVLANNICYGIQDKATEIFVGNWTNRIVNNSLLGLDKAGKPQPDRPLIRWNLSLGGAYEEVKPLAAAEKTYRQQFSHNLERSVAPRFVDEAHFDFHLAADSALLGAGIGIADARWGSTAGAVDLGAYGATVTKLSYAPEDVGMVLGRAGDFAGAVKALRGRGAVAHKLALEAALLRADDDDEGAAAVLARMGTVAQDDRMGRFERVRQGNADVALWEELAGNVDANLEIADLYIQWGLNRDALELLNHRYERPAAVLENHTLVRYYRSYCRDLLDFEYYAGTDLTTAGTVPLNGAVPRLPGAWLVLAKAIERDPADARARYLLGVWHQNAGRMEAAREQYANARRLQPGFAEAETALRSLGGAPATRKARAAPATVAAGGVSAPAAAGANTPLAIVARALRAAASGDAKGAMGFFTAANFPANKQEDAVRAAYMELRLRELVAKADAKQCGIIDDAITNLDQEDKALPFTFTGLGGFMKGTRFQFWLGMLEFQCLDERVAKKRWAKLAKANEPVASVEYAYPYLALARVDEAGAKAKAKTALGLVERQLGADATVEAKGALLHSKGLLLKILGRREEAMASFRAGVEAGPAGMVEYLNLDAIRLLDAGR